MSFEIACRCSVKATAVWKHYQLVVYQIKTSTAPTWCYSVVHSEQAGAVCFRTWSPLTWSAMWRLNVFGVPDISTHLIERNSRGTCVWPQRPGLGSAASSLALRHQPRCRSCPQRSRPGGPSCDPGSRPSTRPCRWDRQETSAPGLLRSPAGTQGQESPHPLPCAVWQSSFTPFCCFLFWLFVAYLSTGSGTTKPPIRKSYITKSFVV